MKQTSNEKSRKNDYHSDDENVRYKLNKKIFDTKTSKPRKSTVVNDDDINIRYKLASSPIEKPKSIDRKPKPKPKIKVNFWSNKQSINRTAKPEVTRASSNRRHTVGGSNNELSRPKPIVKVRKRVSFLPSPLFLDNHIPMVTVPDDLTIHLNEEEANDLADDLNQAFVNSQEEKSNETSKNKPKPTTNQTSPKGAKRKRNSEDSQGNEYELEFFSKYVVQKLRRMETNQRIYSENLINTVLMLGQLGKLNVKCKISEL